MPDAPAVPPAVAVDEPRRRFGSALRRAAWVGLAAAVVCVVALPARLPLYDYEEWLLQGRILHDLITGTVVNGRPVGDVYALVGVPVPNLAAPLGIALLNLVLPIEAAGRAFLVAGCVGFVTAFAVLVRRLQGHPTVMEYTGPLWVLGYFLYRGYVSYLFGLPLAFVGIAAVQPVLAGRPLSRRRAVLLTALGLLTYLAHLVPWAVLVLALVAHAAVLARRGRRRDAAGLLATTTPALVLLAWYALAAPGEHRLSLYAGARDKGLALAEPLQFFLRIDPFPDVVPTTVLEVLVVAGLVGLAAPLLRAWRPRLGHPVVLTGLVLLVLAVLDPVGNLNSLTKPDQRLLFPAILLLLAALPWRRPGAGRRVAAVAGVLAVTGLHLVQLLSVQPGLDGLATAAQRLIPPRASVATVAVSVDGGCGPTIGPTIGVPSLKWVDVTRLLAAGQIRADLQETAGIGVRAGVPPAGLTALNTAAGDVGSAVAGAGSPAYVEVFACPPDLLGAQRRLAPGYRPVAGGDTFVILQRTPPS